MTDMHATHGLPFSQSMYARSRRTETRRGFERFGFTATLRIVAADLFSGVFCFSRAARLIVR